MLQLAKSQHFQIFRDYDCFVKKNKVPVATDLHLPHLMLLKVSRDTCAADHNEKLSD